MQLIFTPKPVPVHLMAQGWFNSTKSITIVYTTGEADILSFSTKTYNK
jgi:hypothetical protein